MHIKQLKLGKLLGDFHNTNSMLNIKSFILQKDDDKTLLLLVQYTPEKSDFLLERLSGIYSYLTH